MIFLFSHQPANISDQQSGFFVDILGSIPLGLESGILTFITRKAAHFFSYFVLGLLVFTAINTHRFTIKKTTILSIITVLSYAVFDETHQLFILGRSGEIRDVLIDTTAGAVGIGLLLLTRQKYRKSGNKSKSML